MTTVYETIKDKLSMLDIAGRYTAMERAGSNGRYRGLCPLHTEKTPSFFVYSQAERWYCFGCGKGGDVFDLVGAIEHLDARDALKQLASEAHVELTPLTPEQQTANDAEKQRTTILSAAVAYWQQNINRPNSPGMEYAIGRGFNDETIASEGIGYHHDGESLRAALVRANVDLSHPVARAVLSTPPDCLIYPHIWMGRVTYYAARGIYEKRHWNPPADLAGQRQPYYNHIYTKKAAGVIIVEGQGDAAALAQLGQPAVARAGATLDAATIKTLRERHKQIWIGIENDATGQESAYKLAEQFGAMCRLIKWGDAPKADANDLLKNGIDKDLLHTMLYNSQTWLNILIEQYIKSDVTETEDAIRHIFSSLVHLDQFTLSRLTDTICESLGMTKSTFSAMLKVARLEAGMEQTGRPAYEIIGGQTCLRSYGRYGDESISTLLNASAHIVADIVSDDGQTQTRLLEIEGTMPDSAKLPLVEITAEDFNKMSWVIPSWGARVILTAGNGTAQHLRAAIQTLSTEVKMRHEYTHLGWRKIEDATCYLSASGALGRDGVIVRPPVDMRRYQLPKLNPDALPEALRASLRFLDVGDHRITIPLWASMFLAPLASIMPPAFSVWLFGTTGSMKSTVTALAMCHYGQFSYNLPAPASWTSTTAYALRVKAFLCKDAPLWIDDYAKQSTGAGENELRKLAETLLREFGNRTGRSAGQADGSLRTSHDPRGLVISTAEQLPPNPSIHPRLFAIEIHPGDITHGAGSPLTQAQTHDAALYPMAMAGYLTWLSGQMDGLTAQLHTRRDVRIAEATQTMQHLRSPMNVATMYIGWEMGMTYLHDMGIIDDDQYSGWLQYGWDILLKVGDLQDSDINREEDPIRLYFEAIDNILMQGVGYLRHRDAPDNPATDKPTIANRQTNASFLGWYDDNYWYMLDKPAYNAVMDFYRHGGMSFPDSARGVKIKLMERGMLHPDPSEAYRHRIKIGNDLVWVHRITREPEKKPGE